MDQAISTLIQISGVNYEFVEGNRQTAKEVASSIGVSLRTIYRWRKRGLPFFGEFTTVQIVRTWQVANPEALKS